MAESEVKSEPENIGPAKPGIPIWNPNDVAGSLQAILIYVECEANRSIKWYWKNKGSKSFFSQLIRFAAFTLTALSGIYPIAARMLPHPKDWDSGLVSSLLLGVAAGLFGLDKAFGISSGWTRYVLTATLLEKTLEEFRLQWTVLMAKADLQPTPDQVQALLACARDFRVAVAAAVLQETKDWVTEFQNNLAQLEQETRAQLATLRAKVEQTAKTKEAEAKSGAIELTVMDADATDGFAFQVIVEGENGPVVKETVRNMKTWVGLAIAPGQYRLLLSARISEKDIAAAKAIVVSPGEKTEISARLH